MSLQQFLRALYGRFSVFITLLVVTFLAATITSLLLPKYYKTTVSLLVDAKDEQSLTSVLRHMHPPREMRSNMKPQRLSRQSRKVAHKVVQDMKLADDPGMLEAFHKQAGNKGPIEDWLVDDLLKRFKVETSQSSVIQASFTYKDPRFAALAANAFAKAYIDTILELRVEPTRQAAIWFDEQLKSLRANLEDAQAKLTEYHQRQGIVSADERSDVENSQLSALSEQVVRAQEQTFQWQSREQQARRFLDQGTSVDGLPDVLDNPFIQRLKADLLHGEARLQELATQYGSNYPLYRRQASENQSLREKLDAEMKKILAGIESSTRQSRQREAQLVKAMTAQRTRVLDLKEHRNELTLLKRNVESAERAYDTAMQRSVVNQVDSRASQTNVTVLNPAFVPSAPSQPKIVLNMLLSLVVGTTLGLGTVLLLEMFDRRVRTRGDLELLSGVPLLGVVDSHQQKSVRLLGWSEEFGRAQPSRG